MCPDPREEQGRERLHVGVAGGADVETAVREGYRANLPVRTIDAAVAEIAPLVSVDHPGVVVEAVKLAEDGSGDVVVRLYEALGRRASARVSLGFDAADVVETDLLERELSPTALVGVDADGATLALRPFEIVTLRMPRA